MHIYDEYMREVWIVVEHLPNRARRGQRQLGCCSNLWVNYWSRGEMGGERRGKKEGRELAKCQIHTINYQTLNTHSQIPNIHPQIPNCGSTIGARYSQNAVYWWIVLDWVNLPSSLILCWPDWGWGVEEQSPVMFSMSGTREIEWGREGDFFSLQQIFWNIYQIFWYIYQLNLDIYQVFWDIHQIFYLRLLWKLHVLIRPTDLSRVNEQKFTSLLILKKRHLCLEEIFNDCLRAKCDLANW